MTLKQALIYLIIKQVAYRDRWHFIAYRQQLPLEDPEANRQTVQALISQGIWSNKYCDLFQDWADHVQSIRALESRP